MADKTFKRIAITTEEMHPDEAIRIKAVLNADWDMVHLRHPAASLREMRSIIEAVPQELHHRIRLHGHFELLNEFNLGGVHLNRRCPTLPRHYSGGFSCSCHSADDVKKAINCDYVTLSPIFNSISKIGYKANFTDDELQFINRNAPTQVIALGGISPHNILKTKQLGFNGFATLGSLMGAESQEKFAESLNKFNNEYNNLI